MTFTFTFSSINDSRTICTKVGVMVARWRYGAGRHNIHAPLHGFFHNFFLVHDALLTLGYLRLHWCCWGFRSCGIWRFVVVWMVPDVSKDTIDFVFKGKNCPRPLKMKAILSFEMPETVHRTTGNDIPEESYSHLFNPSHWWLLIYNCILSMCDPFIFLTE